jgi:hypothetical protein
MRLVPSYLPPRLITCLLLLLAVTSIQAAPSISGQPQSITVAQNAAASFSVTATGAGTLSYQWQKDGVDIAGATNGNISISNIQSANVGFYRCKVTDSNGLVTSAEASLRLNGLPLFKVMQNSLTWQQAKVDAVANGGRLAVLDSQAKINHLNAWLQSINNLRLLWIGLTDEEVEGTWKWINGTALGASNWGSGEPNNNGSGEDYAHLLDVGNASKWNDLPNDWWIYTPGGYLLELLPQISFTAQPQTQTVNPGQAATLSAIVSGAGSLTYQWQKDGVDIPGATGSTYSLASVKPWHIGDYTIKVTDTYGTVTSEAATLSITAINTGLWRGLVAYYPFDGTLNDATLFGKHGAKNGVSEYSINRFGAISSAVLFSGSGSISVVPSGFDTREDFSISFWVWGDPSGNGTYLGTGRVDNFVSTGLESSGGLNFRYVSFQNPKWQFFTGWIYGNPFLGFDQHEYVSNWRHLTYSKKDSTTKVYADGLLQSVLENTPSAVQLDSILLGQHKDADAQGLYSMYGKIDDLRFYKRALTDTEVRSLYSAENAFNNWSQTHFGSTAKSGSAADGADPDQDGLPNLLEYALNLPPNAASRAPAAVQAAGGNLEYTYTRGTAAYNGGTTFQVEWSDDLTTWFTNGVVESLLTDDGTQQQVKATLPTGSGGRRFVRLRVQ